MTDLFTRDGRALAVHRDGVFARDGRQLARRHGDFLFAPDGRYAGTVVGDRIVYRATDDVAVRPAFALRRHVGSLQADRPRVALRGEEPFGPATPAQTDPVTAASTPSTEEPVARRVVRIEVVGPGGRVR